jgi:opacity protein-like surface antigen
MRNLNCIAGAAVVSALVGITAATAADMAPRMYTKAPAPVAIVYDWTGFYIGGNLGYSWGRASTDGDLTGTQNVSVFRGGITPDPTHPPINTRMSTVLSAAGRPVTIGSAAPGCSVWKRTFRAATSAEAPMSVSSRDVRRAPVSWRQTTSSTGLVPRAAVSVSFRPSAS